MNSQQSKHANSGLISSLIGAIKNIIALAINRIELATLELSEMRGHLFKVFLLSMLGVIALWFALIFWSGLVIVLAWDNLRWKILLIMAIFFSIAALGLGLYVRNMLKQGRLGFPSTMAELRKDRDALF